MKTTRKLLFLLIAMLAISNVCFAQSDNNVEEEVLEEETLEYSVSSSNGLPDNVTDEIFGFLETVGNAMLDAIIDFFNIILCHFYNCNSFHTLNVPMKL